MQVLWEANILQLWGQLQLRAWSSRSKGPLWTTKLVHAAAYDDVWLVLRDDDDGSFVSVQPRIFVVRRTAILPICTAVARIKLAEPDQDSSTIPSFQSWWYLRHSLLTFRCHLARLFETRSVLDPPNSHLLCDAGTLPRWLRYPVTAANRGKNLCHRCYCIANTGINAPPIYSTYPNGWYATISTSAWGAKEGGEYSMRLNLYEEHAC
jgi:hypothetical protein